MHLLSVGENCPSIWCGKGLITGTRVMKCPLNIKSCHSRYYFNERSNRVLRASPAGLDMKQSSAHLWVTLVWLHTSAHQKQRREQRATTCENGFWTRVFWTPSTSRYSLTRNTNAEFVAVNLPDAGQEQELLKDKPAPWLEMTPTLVVMQQV